VPHAYLEGRNIEIMASSDNVLRGGLTTKHIDVPELLKHVKCEPTYPNIIKGEMRNGERVYKTPAPDFELSLFNMQEGDELSFMANTAEILLLAEGEVTASDGSNKVTLKPGSPSAVVFPGDKIGLKSAGNSLLFRASVPVHNGE
jgi:mannose-6-phosphate isomerase